MGITEKKAAVRTTVQATAKALSILDCFSVERPELSLAQISQITGLSKSTLIGQLNTLLDAGYLLRMPDSQNYRLGYKITEVNYRARRATPLSQYVVPIMEDLNIITGQSVYLTTHLDGLLFYLECVYPNRRPVTYSIAGRTLPMHCTAGGKAMLSCMTKKQVEAIIDRHGMIQKTDHTITEKNRLFEELRSCKKQGYAIDMEEETIGVQCIGMPIRTREGRVAGAISLSGTVIYMQSRDIREFLTPLSQAVRQIMPYAGMFPSIQSEDSLR